MSAGRPPLRAVPASGEPTQGHIGETATGLPIIGPRHTACPGCEFRTTKGQQISYYERRWWHLPCAQKHLASKPRSQAWIALAEQLVKAPSQFKPREVRVITQALLDLARPGGATWEVS